MRPRQPRACGRSCSARWCRRTCATCSSARNGLFLDFFDAFLGPLEQELSRQVGAARRGARTACRTCSAYTTAHQCDELRAGRTTTAPSRATTTRADVILVGVSRSGKTPTCLYMAMQYGIFAANYPLTEDDFEAQAAAGAAAHARPRSCSASPSRRSGCSRSATSAARTAATHPLSQCEFEVRTAEDLFQRLRHSVP